MSTRGVIARKTAKGWIGVYHHFDSYPAGLGAEMWKLIHKEFKNDISTFLKFAIDEHPGGWSNITATVILEENALIVTDKGYCYCHGPNAKHHDSASSLIVYPECVKDPQEKYFKCLFLEWVYIIDPKTLKMEIWNHYDTGEPILIRGTNEQNQKFEYESTQYDWLPIAIVDLNGAEPNWSKIEQIADTITNIMSHVRDKNILKRRKL